MSAIADMLASSRAEHLNFLRNVPHKVAQGGAIATVPGNPALAKASLQAASDWREQAHREDPEHADPAWGIDTATHEALMAFYAKELAK